MDGVGSHLLWCPKCPFGCSVGWSSKWDHPVLQLLLPVVKRGFQGKTPEPKTLIYPLTIQWLTQSRQQKQLMQLSTIDQSKWEQSQILKLNTTPRYTSNIMFGENASSNATEPFNHCSKRTQIHAYHMQRHKVAQMVAGHDPITTRLNTSIFDLPTKVVCKFQWRVSPMYLNQFAVEWHGSLNSMTIPSFSLSFPRLGAWPTGRHVWLIGESLWQRDESWRRKRGVSTGRDMSRLVQNVGNQRKSFKRSWVRHCIYTLEMHG